MQVAFIPAGGFSIAALVGCDRVVPGLRQHGHHLAPGVRELGESVKQQHARAAGIAGLKDVHRQAVDAVDAARTNYSRKIRWAFQPRTCWRTPSESASTRDRQPAMSPMVCG